MLIWLINVGEWLPIDTQAERLLRVGILAQTLQARGHDVVWWGSTFDHVRKRHRFNHDTDIALSKKLRLSLIHSPGYRENVSIGRLYDHQRLAWVFRQRARREQKPHLILTSLPTMEISLEATRYGLEQAVPVVLDIRDLWPEVFLDLVPRWGRPFARIALGPYYDVVRRACTQATALTGVTDEYVNWGLRLARRDRSMWDSSFPMGYQEDSPTPASVSEARAYWKRFGITADDGRFRVCFFGTLGRQFDIDTVLQVARTLQGVDPSIQFVLCGEGDNASTYRDLAEDLPNVLLPGWIDSPRIWTLMRLSSVGLAPYWNTNNFLLNVPNKPAEYLSAGLPIVTSLGGNLQKLLEGHDCGLIYPERDADALARSLCFLKANPSRLQEMSSRAQALFRSRFTATRVYDAMVTHIESLIEAGRQAHNC